MKELSYFLETYFQKYNNPEFIESDPISIPHLFTAKKDIEIAGFLSATIAWGNRKAILKSANTLMQWMDNSPFDFITNHTKQDLLPFEKFVYRTFNGIDTLFFIKSLQNIYINHGGLENIFTLGYSNSNSIKEAISYFRKVFLSIDHEQRSEKHIANTDKGSAAKRINMYLRWMVRNDNRGVDFGLWNNISPAHLMIPLDVHSGNIARQLGLLKRKQNDWKAVEELTLALKSFDSSDPVKYDFALFGAGVNGIDV